MCDLYVYHTGVSFKRICFQLSLANYNLAIYAFMKQRMYGLLRVFSFWHVGASYMIMYSCIYACAYVHKYSICAHIIHIYVASVVRYTRSNNYTHWINYHTNSFFMNQYTHTHTERIRSRSGNPACLSSAWLVLCCAVCRKTE